MSVSVDAATRERRPSKVKRFFQLVFPGILALLLSLIASYIIPVSGLLLRAVITALAVILVVVATKWLTEKELNGVWGVFAVILAAGAGQAIPVRDAVSGTHENQQTRSAATVSTPDSTLAALRTAYLQDLMRAEVHGRLGRFDRAEDAAEAAVLRLQPYSGDPRIDSMIVTARRCSEAVRQRVSSQCKP
jgi:hypothetical protein